MTDQLDLTAPVTADAATLLGSLGAVVQWLRHTPLTNTDSMHATFKGQKPKPRHIAALLNIGVERVSVSELADRLQVSLATASQLVSDLDDLGLVQRVEDPSDRRRTLVEISETHRPAVDSVLSARLRPLEHALARLSPAERHGLCHGVSRLAKELDSQAQTTAPLTTVSQRTVSQGTQGNHS